MLKEKIQTSFSVKWQETLNFITRNIHEELKFEFIEILNGESSCLLNFSIKLINIITENIDQNGLSLFKIDLNKKSSSFKGFLYLYWIYMPYLENPFNKISMNPKIEFLKDNLEPWQIKHCYNEKNEILCFGIIKIKIIEIKMENEKNFDCFNIEIKIRNQKGISSFCNNSNICSFNQEFVFSINFHNEDDFDINFTVI